MTFGAAFIARLGALALFGLVALGCSGSSATSLEQQLSGADADEVPVADAANRADGSGGVLDVDGDGDEVFVRPTVEIPDDWPSAVEAVYGRYWLYWEAFEAAHGPPIADPDYEPLQELSTEENWESLHEQLKTFAEDGVILTLPDPSDTEHLIRIPNTSVLTEEEGAEVILQDCWIDDFIQQTLDGQVLAEGKEAKLMNVTMRVVDGEWRVDGIARATTESDGFEQCVTLVS